MDPIHSNNVGARRGLFHRGAKVKNDRRPVSRDTSMSILIAVRKIALCKMGNENGKNEEEVKGNPSKPWLIEGGGVKQYREERLTSQKVSRFTLSEFINRISMC